MLYIDRCKYSVLPELVLNNSKAFLSHTQTNDNIHVYENVDRSNSIKENYSDPGLSLFSSKSSMSQSLDADSQIQSTKTKALPNKDADISELKRAVRKSTFNSKQNNNYQAGVERSLRTFRDKLRSIGMTQHFLDLQHYPIAIDK